ncbi:hypothetical protein [Microbulbifer sp. ZKSA002]|uniref:hypothetical protein n=1 Tax=Microbulbifer sp. ZKSA002 TaxID=3243388 RepID=UPI00403908C4
MSTNDDVYDKITDAVLNAAEKKKEAEAKKAKFETQIETLQEVTGLSRGEVQKIAREVLAKQEATSTQTTEESEPENINLKKIFLILGMLFLPAYFSWFLMQKKYKGMVRKLAVLYLLLSIASPFIVNDSDPFLTDAEYFTFLMMQAIAALIYFAAHRLLSRLLNSEV